MRSVLGNYGWLALGDVSGRLMLLGATLYLGQTLGRAGFGQISFAYAVVIYAIWLGNMGLPLYGAREVAREPGRLGEVIGRVVATRLVLAVAAFLVLAVSVRAIPALRAVGGLVLGYGIWLVPAALLLDWVFQGLENNRPVSLARGIDRLVYAAIVVATVRGASDVGRVPWAWAAGAAAGAAWLVIALRRRGARIVWRGSLHGLVPTVRRAFPLGLSFLMIQIFMSLDTVMLGMLRGDAPGGAYAEVGAYAAAYRLVLFLLGFAALAGTVLYPVLTRLGQESATALEPVLKASGRLTLAAGLPLAVGGSLLAVPLMGLAWGDEYRLASAAPFRVLIWSVATVFANVPYATILLAGGRETRYLRVVSAGAALNVAANALLIPRFGPLGAAWATMASELLVLMLFVVEARTIARRGPLVDAARPALACVPMVATVLALRAVPWLALVAGGLVYVAGCVALRQLSRADLATLRDVPVRRA